MTVTDKAWQSYIKKLSAINRKAAKIMQDWISVNGLDYPEELISYAYGIVGKYGEAAGSLACEMYDTLARAQGKILPDAVPAEPATYSEVAKAVIGTKKERPGQVPDTVARLVKQTAADTTLQNAKRDGAQFAWIPHGDTCSFCITLASRGWQYMSKNALKNGHAEHIHANCDCEYGVRFDGKSNVAGYDPDKYLEQYNNAEGTKPRDKINSMRREQYKANGDKIREQKREAYARIQKRLPENKLTDIIRIKEESRRTYGSDDRAVVSDVISTQTYAERFKMLGESDKISDIMAFQTRKTLWRRNGTPYEDLIFIDSTTGRVATQRLVDIPGGVNPTEEMKSMVVRNKGRIIAIHNHPHNNLPSRADLLNALRYKYGVVACHNGRIIKYSVSKDANIELVDALLNYIQPQFDEGSDISLSLEMLSIHGVKMEVF